jgi:hypothetical protein
MSYYTEEQLRTFFDKENGIERLRNIYYDNLKNHLENKKRGSNSSRKIPTEEEVINNIEKVFQENNISIEDDKLGNDLSIKKTQYWSNPNPRDAIPPNTEAEMVKEWWIGLDDLTNEFMQNWGGWYNKTKKWAEYLDNEGKLLPRKFFLPLDNKYSKVNKEIRFQPYCYLCGFSLFRELKKRQKGEEDKKGKWISYSVKTLDEAAAEIKKGAKLSLEVEHVFPVDEQRALLLGQPNAKKWKKIKDDLKSKKKKDQQNAKSIYQIYNKVYLWSHTTCNQVKSCAGMTSYSDSNLNLPKNIKNLNINIPSYETVIKTISNGSTNINYKGDKVCNQDQGNWNYKNDNTRTLDINNINLEYKSTVRLGRNPGIRRNISFRNNIIAPFIEKRMKERIKNKKNKPVWEDMNKMLEDDSDSSPEDIYDGIRPDLIESINDYTTERAKKIGNRITDIIKTYQKRPVSTALKTYRKSIKNLKASKKSKTFLPLTTDNVTRDENLDYRPIFDAEEDSAYSDSESVTSEESVNEVRQRLNSMERLTDEELKIEGYKAEKISIKEQIKKIKKELKVELPGIDRKKKEEKIISLTKKLKKKSNKIKNMDNTSNNKTKKRKSKSNNKSVKKKAKKGGRKTRKRRRRRKTKRKTK